MSKPRLLDLFCGAGGAGAGYHYAGFDVVGVDLALQPNYPFEFHQADALDVLNDVIDRYSEPGWELFDAIHASPPCQAHSVAKSIRPDYEWPDLLSPTRTLLEKTGIPWVIENVPGAPMRKDLVLCGTQFGLEHNGFEVRRHRWFEFWDSSIVPLVSPCWHRLPPAYLYGHGADTKHVALYGRSSQKDWKHLMRADWMTNPELAQAIPPSFTEFIGQHLMAHVRSVAA